MNKIRISALALLLIAATSIVFTPWEQRILARGDSAYYFIGRYYPWGDSNCNLVRLEWYETTTENGFTAKIRVWHITSVGMLYRGTVDAPNGAITPETLIVPSLTLEYEFYVSAKADYGYANKWIIPVGLCPVLFLPLIYKPWSPRGSPLFNVNTIKNSAIFVPEGFGAKVDNPYPEP